MSSALNNAEAVIRTEYRLLCEALGLSPLAIHIYVCDDSSTATTSLGIQEANCDPLYSGIKNQMVLPLASAEDQWPKEAPSFPPTMLAKFSSEWPAWRIELWHEVVHQVSNDILQAWNPRESPRTRTNGSWSAPGHGSGWFAGLQKVATKLSLDADALDELLDQ